MNPLIDFFNKVIVDIQDNNLTNQQILFISQFYTHYNSFSNTIQIDKQSKTNSKLNFSPSIYDLLTAGITFYSSLTDSLDINLNLDSQQNEVIKNE